MSIIVNLYYKGHDGSAAAYGPAGTDLHHLISGDGKVNTNYHNDLPYGNVDKTKTYKDASAEFAWLAGNLVGTPIKTSPQDTQVEVFEPRDEDKGDIARACFYMVARYNNLAGETGVISDYEPNLALADYATGTGVAEYSTDTKPVYMGIMSDLLAWNALDPVDDYEIHRNNLIFNNYQNGPTSSGVAPAAMPTQLLIRLPSARTVQGLQRTLRVPSQPLSQAQPQPPLHRPSRKSQPLSWTA